MAHGVDNGIQAEADIRQATLRISRGENFAIGKCALTGLGRGTVAAEYVRISTQSSKGIQSAIQTCNPRCALRKAGVRTLPVVVGNEKDSVAAAQDQFVAQLVGGSDSRRKVCMSGLVQTTIATGIEYQLTRISCADCRADRVRRGEIKIFLIVIALNGCSLDFVAQSKIQGQFRSSFPVILQIPAEHMFVGRGEFVEPCIVGSATYAKQE